MSDVAVKLGFRARRNRIKIDAVLTIIDTSCANESRVAVCNDMSTKKAEIPWQSRLQEKRKSAQVGIYYVDGRMKC